MPMKFNNDKELLEFVSREGVGRTHAQGYFWFWREFVPALERAKTLSQVADELLSDCHYVAGDVHDFNDAPRAAIKCYLNSLNVDPHRAEAHREIANMLGKMGRYDKALANSDTALSLNPDDRHTISDREDYIGKNRLSPPLYVKGDAHWIAREHLAHAKPQKALKALGKAKGLAALRAKAHCYAAMKKSKEYLQAWSEIARVSDEIKFTYADWFFMESNVYHEPELWARLLSSKAKFSGVFTVFEGLDESERYRSLSTHKKIRLRLKYYVCAQSGNTKCLKALFEKYPEWVELGGGLE